MTRPLERVGSSGPVLASLPRAKEGAMPTSLPARPFFFGNYRHERTACRLIRRAGRSPSRTRSHGRLGDRLAGTACAATTATACAATTSTGTARAGTACAAAACTGTLGGGSRTLRRRNVPHAVNHDLARRIGCASRRCGGLRSRRALSLLTTEGPTTAATLRGCGGLLSGRALTKLTEGTTTAATLRGCGGLLSRRALTKRTATTTTAATLRSCGGLRSRRALTKRTATTTTAATLRNCGGLLGRRALTKRTATAATLWSCGALTLLTAI